jgi:hypothetical protein
MDASTVTSSTFTVNDGISNISGTVSYSAMTANFTPSTDLAYGTTYTVTITTGVMDLSGNALTTDYTWSFTTGSPPDTTPPTVISTSPVNGVTGVDVNTTITADFSEAMDASTINTGTFTVNDVTGSIAGTVSFSGTTATFTPATDLDHDTTYTATITTDVTDLAGNQLEADHTWSFTTQPFNDGGAGSGCNCAMSDFDGNVSNSFLGWAILFVLGLLFIRRMKWHRRR